MKSAPIEAPCPCGEPLKGEIGKPTRMTPAVTKIRCGCCGSYFLIKLFKVNKDQARFESDLLELSPKLKKILKSRPTKLKTS